MRIIILFFLFFSPYLPAQDTFSIVAVDPETGEVGAAGASCIDTDDCGGCGGVIIINDLIPGRGGMNSQAYACLPNVNLQNGINQLITGASPEEAIDFVTNNDACVSGGVTSNNSAYRQYGIADLNAENQPRAAAFTGASTDAYAGHIVGENYAIQGNILLGEEILTEMEAGFLNTEGSLADKLMAALQGANVPGADTRCLAAGISSKSAFIRVAQPDDVNGEFYLEINVPIVPAGVEPIDTLQTLFDEWKETLSSNLTFGREVFTFFPNPTQGDFRIDIPSNLRGLAKYIRIYDAAGKMLLLQEIQSANPLIERHNIPTKNLIFVEISNQNQEVLQVEKVILY